MAAHLDVSLSDLTSRGCDLAELLALEEPALEALLAALGFSQAERDVLVAKVKAVPAELTSEELEHWLSQLELVAQPERVQLPGTTGVLLGGATDAPVGGDPETGEAGDLNASGAFTFALCDLFGLEASEVGRCCQGDLDRTVKDDAQHGDRMLHQLVSEHVTAKRDWQRYETNAMLSWFLRLATDASRWVADPDGTHNDHSFGTMFEAMLHCAGDVKRTLAFTAYKKWVDDRWIVLPAIGQPQLQKKQKLTRVRTSLAVAPDGRVALALLPASEQPQLQKKQKLTRVRTSLAVAPDGRVALVLRTVSLKARAAAAAERQLVQQAVAASSTAVAASSTAAEEPVEVWTSEAGDELSETRLRTILAKMHESFVRLGDLQEQMEVMRAMAVHEQGFEAFQRAEEARWRQSDAELEAAKQEEDLQRTRANQARDPSMGRGFSRTPKKAKAKQANKKQVTITEPSADAKSQLNILAPRQHYRVHYTSQKLPSGNFVATVTLGGCNSCSEECRTGGEASTIKGAEQLAAALAVAYLEQLPSDDQ